MPSFQHLKVMHQAVHWSGFGPGAALTVKEMRKEQISPCSLPELGSLSGGIGTTIRKLARNYALVLLVLQLISVGFVCNHGSTTINQ